MNKKNETGSETKRVENDDEISEKYHEAKASKKKFSKYVLLLPYLVLLSHF